MQCYLIVALKLHQFKFDSFNFSDPIGGYHLSVEMDPQLKIILSLEPSQPSSKEHRAAFSPYSRLVKWIKLRDGA